MEGGEDAGGRTESIAPSGLSAAFGCGLTGSPGGRAKIQVGHLYRSAHTSVIHSLSPVNFRGSFVLSADWNGLFFTSQGLEK